MTDMFEALKNLSSSNDIGASVTFQAICVILSYILVAFLLFVIVMTIIKFKKVSYKIYFIAAGLLYVPCIIPINGGSPFDWQGCYYPIRTSFLMAFVFIIIGFVVYFFGKKKE